MMHHLNKLFFICCASSLPTFCIDTPQALIASMPSVVKTAFEQSLTQLNQLKKEGKKTPTELYMPTAQATVAIAFYAAEHPQERDAVLNGLNTALKLSFWTPDVWSPGFNKPTDARYNDLFASAQTDDGADKLIGQAFISQPLTRQGITDTITYLITIELYKYRQNNKLQGSLINALCTFLKTMYDVQDIISATMNNAAGQSLGYYAGLAESIITQELPKYIPLIRGIMVIFFIDELIKCPALGAQSTSARPTDLAPITKVQRQLSTARTAEQYGTAVKDIISSFDQTVSPTDRYYILNEIRGALLASPMVMPPVIPKAGALEKQGSGCAWYEIHCWVDKGMNQLSSVIQDKIINPITGNTRDIANKLKEAANLLTCVPDIMADKTKKIIGGKNDTCKDHTTITPSDQLCTNTNACTKKTCPTTTGNDGKTTIYVCVTQQVPTMAQGLKDGAQTIGNNVTGILATLTRIQAQRAKVQQMNLRQYGISDLNNLEEALLKAFNSLEAALISLAQPECTAGALCNVKNALERAAVHAQNGAESITKNIEKLRNDINAPSDGSESLVSKIRNVARILE